MNKALASGLYVRLLAVEEPGGGTISGTTYHAPKVPGVYHVREVTVVAR